MVIYVGFYCTNNQILTELINGAYVYFMNKYDKSNIEKINRDHNYVNYNNIIIEYLNQIDSCNYIKYLISEKEFSKKRLIYQNI